MKETFFEKKSRLKKKFGYVLDYNEMTEEERSSWCLLWELMMQKKIREDPEMIRLNKKEDELIEKQIVLTNELIVILKLAPVVILLAIIFALTIHFQF